MIQLSICSRFVRSDREDERTLNGIKVTERREQISIVQENNHHLHLTSINTSFFVQKVN